MKISAPAPAKNPGSDRLLIRIILIRIRIQDVKKLVTDPDPGQTLIRLWIQAKMIRIGMQGNYMYFTDPDAPHWLAIPFIYLLFIFYLYFYIYLLGRHCSGHPCPGRR